MKNKKDLNFLEFIPERKNGIKWTVDENSIVTLEIENSGLFNKIAQKFFKKHKISYIHLDETGSFIWPLIDGKTNILEIGKMVSKNFGDSANPLYERLANYFRILESYSFITLNK